MSDSREPIPEQELANEAPVVPDKDVNEAPTEEPTEEPTEHGEGAGEEAAGEEADEDAVPDAGEQSDDEVDMDSELHRLKSHRRAPAERSDSAEPKDRRRPPRRAEKSDSAEATPRRKPRKSQQPASDDENEEDLDEATKERRALEARIDAALQPSSKRRKKLAGDDIEALQDESIAAMRDAMREAALQDVECIREGRPAINKVKMLPEVADMLQKKALAYSILDGNLLESVRIWLEPLPDASLPSFEIQKALFTALLSLPIKTIHLRESGLGRVVLFYQKSKRPQPAIKRMAQKLIGDWTRPIIGRSDNYRDKRVATVDFNPDALSTATATAGLGRRGEPLSSYEESAARRGRAAMPSSAGVSYRVAPSSTMSYSSEAAQAGVPGASKDSQLRRMKAKLSTAGRSGRKKAQVSVEGRGLN